MPVLEMPEEFLREHKEDEHRRLTRVFSYDTSKVTTDVDARGQSISHHRETHAQLTIDNPIDVSWTKIFVATALVVAAIGGYKRWRPKMDSAKMTTTTSNGQKSERKLEKQ